MTPLPTNILRCMSPKDRQPLGKSGLTQAECDEKGAAKLEKDLQRQIGQYLNGRGIPYLCPTYGKKTRVKVGWPDFTLCFEGKFIAFEVKAMKGKLSLDQEKVICDLIYHGARVVVVRELGQVKATLDAIESDALNKDFRPSLERQQTKGENAAIATQSVAAVNLKTCQHEFTEAFVSKEFDVENVCMKCGKTYSEIAAATNESGGGCQFKEANG